MDLNLIKRRLNLSDFSHDSLLELALSDTTYINHKTGQGPEEKKRQLQEHRRLAHLGDSLMNAAVVDYLYRTFPDADQGWLTKMGQALKDRKGATTYARAVGLDQPDMSNLSRIDDFENRDKLYSELFEALLAALYVAWDYDMNAVRNWFQTELSTALLNIIRETEGTL